MALIERDWDGVDEKPWLVHARVLLGILTAPSGEEFDRRAKRFSRAFRGFRDCLMRNRQNPAQNDGRSIRDAAVESVLLQLNGAALNWRGYPDEGVESRMRRGALVSKVNDLTMKRDWIPK
jgi:hypothetical protein